MSERLRALDGVRAISVGAVVLGGFHWLMPFGWIGVLVFYVLSGFLITHILVDEKTRATSAGSYFGRFYFRRTLRIFPLYFAYLFLLDLAYQSSGVPQGWPATRPYAFTYTVNFGIIAREVSAGPAWGHLWTLSVEEQFYLLWPLVVWLLPRAWLGRVALALIAAGPLVRFVSRARFDLDIGQIYVSSASHVDAFAFGAVLASCDLSRVRRALPLAAGAGAITLAAGLLVVVFTDGSFRTLGYREGLVDANGYIWGYTLLDGTAALLILAAMRGELPWLGQPALAYVGKISYGIYLFQRPLIAVFTASVQPRLAAFVPSTVLQQAIGVAVCAGAAIALAAASYRLLEAPLLRWRDRKVPARATLPAHPQV
jgi:peptidoglycan/LPS O-acetylase OafA/YrhL